jgi:glycosyltransferase involved in cell wall biosynthesis
MTNPSIHLWAPGMFDFKGGIQTYSAFFLQALQQIAPDCPPQVLLMHDRKTPQSQAAITLGHLPPKLRTPSFAAAALSAGLVQRPSLIITTHLNFAPLAYWLKRSFGIPYWAIAHGFEAWDIRNSMLRRSLHHADRILSVSRYTRDRLLHHHLDPVRLLVLPNTFDADRFCIAGKPSALLERHRLSADQPIILTVNRLAAGETYHPYDRVLAALPEIRRVIPNVHYVIVGGGGDRPRLEQEIQNRQLQDCVTLAGFIPDEELSQYYNLCDVFAMPSKLEGFGIVFLEALASGKPVLAGNQDGSVDALKGGELGALVDPDDDQDIAQTLIQILQGTHNLPLMYQPEALRQAVIQNFGGDRFRQTLAQFLSDIPGFAPSKTAPSPLYSKLQP